MKKLKGFFQASRKTVETKLRAGAAKFMDTASDFYAELINSFSINNYPPQYSEFDIMIKNSVKPKVICSNFRIYRVKQISCNLNLSGGILPISALETRS